MVKTYHIKYWHKLFVTGVAETRGSNELRYSCVVSIKINSLGEGNLHLTFGGHGKGFLHFCFGQSGNLLFNDQANENLTSGHITDQSLYNFKNLYTKDTIMGRGLKVSNVNWRLQ